MIADAEQQRRWIVVQRLVAAAAHGDVPAFLDALLALDWHGAWLDAFSALVPVGYVDPLIRHAFVRAWRGDGDWSVIRPIGTNWTIGLDLESRPDLYVKGLRLLTLPYQDAQPPSVLYRGQSLAEHQQGRHGVWWTPYPHIGEWFARSEIRDHTGQRCILAAFDPGPAIIAQLADEEFLIDPAKLDQVELIAVPAPYTAEQEHIDLGQTSILDRVPHGYAPAAVTEFHERMRLAA